MDKEYNIDELKALVEQKDVSKIKAYMAEYDLVIENGSIVPKNKNYYEDKAKYCDLAQYVKKICLNSLYGALLQSSCTFFDFRMGASTTLSGRKVVQHLTSKANELLCGKYADKGYCAEYNDTDSVYCYIQNDSFKAYHPNFDFSKDNIIKFSDGVSDEINNSFPQYMKNTFHCTDEGASLQKAAKEVVASKGLFIGKKRYALAVYEHDGFRQDNDGGFEKKIMGIQVKRSDCPQIVRDLLKKLLESVLTYGDRDKLLDILKDFAKTKWSKLQPWEKGTPKACNKLTFYGEEYKKTGKCSVSQVMGAINWNHLIDVNDDKKTPKILDGDKVIVVKLKKNNGMGMNTVSIPVDLTRKPKWFKELPFDEQSMEDSIIDKTIETVFGVLGWKLTLTNAMNHNEDVLSDILTFED